MDWSARSNVYLYKRTVIQTYLLAASSLGTAKIGDQEISAYAKTADCNPNLALISASHDHTNGHLNFIYRFFNETTRFRWGLFAPSPFSLSPLTVL
jgi:hypothetical protein